MLGGQLVAVAVVCVAAGLYYYRPGPSSASEIARPASKGTSAPPLNVELRGAESKGTKVSKNMISPITVSGSKLFQTVSSSEKGNVVVSPISVVVAMSMAAAGATEGSETAKEIQEAMGHNVMGGGEKKVHEYFSELLQSLKSSDDKVEITVANSIWTQGDVKEDFKAACQNAFGAQGFPLKGKDPVNDWVDKSTKGKITKLLDKDPLGPAVLMNAVYFKGEWTHTFDESKTVDGKFRKFDGSEQPCKLMQKNDKKALYTATAHAHVVGLPYGNKRFMAMLVLPKEEGEAQLSKTIDSLFGNGEEWDKVANSFGPRHVILQLPRFKVEYGAKSLKPALQAMGVKSGFVQNQGFLRMTADPSVYIEDVLHKAVIEVNEQGTEAAAATAVVMTRSLPPPATQVTVDRPFVFAVHDSESKSLLFAAKVVEMQA